MADGKVVYDVDVDDSKVSSQMNKVESKIKSSSSSAANAQKNDQKEVAKEAESSSNKISSAFASAYEKITSDSSSLKKSFSGVFSDISSQLGISSEMLGKAGLAGGLVAVGAAATGMAVSVESSMNKFAASTGVAKDEVGKYQDIMEDIYASNYGDSFEDVADAAARVKQQFEGIDDEGLQSLTESALTLRDTFDMDINETLRGADQLMTQFGLSADEAMDLMAAGAQNGLNYTDELGDNVSEYAGKFAQAGYSADEYFQLLKNGSQNGAYNLDKVNDAINEVTTRLADGTIEDSLSIYSSKTQDLFKAWQKGEASQKDVIDSIVNDIKNCTNEQDKLTMSATAFGTMGEDANAKFVESLSSVGTAFEEVDGTMQSVEDTMSGGVAAQLETLKKNLEMLLVPLGEIFLPLLNTIIGVLIEVVSAIAGVVTAVADWVSGVTEYLSNFEQVWNDLSTWFSELINGIVSWFEETWQCVSDWWENLWNDIFTWFQDTWQGIADWFHSLIGSISDFFQSQFEQMTTNSRQRINDFVSGIKQAFNSVKQIFQGILDFITGVFTGNWRKAWNGVKSIFSGIVSGLAGIFKMPINAIIDGINSFINGVNNIKIPDWVPVVGGKGFSIPNIPRLKVGMDFVPSDFYPAFLDYGEAVLTKEQNAQFRALGGVQGMQNIINGNVTALNGTDTTGLAALIKQGLEQAEINILMNGDLVGKNVTNSVDQNMGLITSRKGRFGI